MEYSMIWETVSEKLDKAIEEDKAYPALLIGGYRHGEIMSLNSPALFDEFIEGDYWRMFEELDPDDDYDEGFEKFTKLIKQGYTFGDYQEFTTLQSRLLALKDEAERLAEQDKKPTELLEPTYDAVRVRCNGYKDGVNVRGYNGGYIELVEYLEQLDNL